MTALLAGALQATMLTAAALLALLALPRASAAIRHALLAASLVAVACAPVATWLLPHWTLPWISTAGVAGVETPATQRFSSVRTGDAVFGAGAERGSVSPLELILAALLAIWAAGVAVHGARVVRALVRLARVRREASEWSDERLRVLSAEAVRAAGLVRAPAILLTPRADLLATWGFVRPCVVLPLQATTWPDERVAVVLTHEFAHIRRRDWIVQVVAEVVRCVHWYNPLVRLACRRLRHESERACDDIVIGSGTPPARYAEHLVAIVRSTRLPGLPWAMAMSMAHTPGLERRISAMLNPTLNRRPLTRLAAAAIVACAVAVALPVIAFQPAPTQDELRGTVYDVTGAVVPEVALSLEDAAGPSATTTTDAEGRFEFPFIRAGEYTLTAQLPGFKKLQQTFTLSAARDWDRAIILQLGTVSESIRVATGRRPDAAATDAAATPVAIRVGGNIRAPRKTHDVKPVYPASMRDAGREGDVTLDAIIGRDGLVHSVRVLGAHVHPDFAIAAADAARQWRFTPTLLNGTPVEVVMTVAVEFRLND